MSYEYTDIDGDMLDIVPSTAAAAVIISASSVNTANVIIIPKADVPTVAAELLKAAGHDYLADYVVEFEAKITAEEQAFAEKKLQDRRDALVKRFARLPVRYDELGPDSSVMRAVNYAINLEDKLAAQP